VLVLFLAVVPVFLATGAILMRYRLGIGWSEVDWSLLFIPRYRVPQWYGSGVELTTRREQGQFVSYWSPCN
jgi:hypothetical protein